MLLLRKGVGTAPGCGAGGPPSLSVFVVGVGCTGAYRSAAAVGAGAAAPGCAGGYEVADDEAVVAARAGFGAKGVVCGVGAAVCRVVPDDLEALIGLEV